MVKYIFKRLGSMVVILLIVSLFIFSIVYLIPGDAATAVLGMEASAEDIANFTARMGLDQPLWVQYGRWLGGILTGDFGDSIFMRRPVLEAIGEHLPPTVSLAIFAQLIALFLSLPAGIVAAYKKNTALDKGVLFFTLLGTVFPSFLLALFLMLFFSVQLMWFPVAGYSRLENGLWEHLRFLFLPALSLGIAQSALITRMTRASLLEVLHTSYIKTARAKGLREGKVVMKHALKNAGLPIITTIGQSFSVLITGAVVIESLFAIPGIGRLILNSISRRDLPIIQGIVLVVTVFYVVINIIIDLLYGAIDPRVRLDKE
ncbi:MAG: ABC transporter permease [Turicibacter sp.]|nr:ABC transporter permease [Turicibacter sp.]